jgi:hypothetical protein
MHPNHSHLHENRTNQPIFTFQKPVLSKKSPKEHLDLWVCCKNLTAAGQGAFFCSKQVPISKRRPHALLNPRYIPALCSWENEMRGKVWGYALQLPNIVDRYFIMDSQETITATTSSHFFGLHVFKNTCTCVISRQFLFVLYFRHTKVTLLETWKIQRLDVVNLFIIRWHCDLN